MLQHLWVASSTEGVHGDDDGIVALFNRIKQKSKTRGKYHDLALADQLPVSEGGGDRALVTESPLHRAGSGSNSSRQVFLVSAAVHRALESWGPGFVRVVLQAGVRIASEIGLVSDSSCDHIDSDQYVPQYVLNPDCAPIVLPFKTATTVVALQAQDFHAWVRLYIDIKAVSLAAAKEQLSMLGALDPRTESVLMDAAVSSRESKCLVKVFDSWIRSSAEQESSPFAHETTSKLSPAAMDALLRPYLYIGEHKAARHSTSSRSQTVCHVFVTLDAKASKIQTLSQGIRSGTAASSSGTVASSSSLTSKRRMSKSERKRIKSQFTRGLTGPTQDASTEKGSRGGPLEAPPPDHHQTLHPVITLRYVLEATKDRPTVVLCTAADICLSYDTALRTR